MGQAPSPSRKPPGQDADPAPDPSMDDILASIRRILDEDQAAKLPSGDVLMLDASMMVENPAAEAPASTPLPAPPPKETIPMTSAKDDLSAPAAPVTREAPPLPAPPPPAPSPLLPGAALALGAEAAAASSVGALMRTLAAERKTTVSRGGMTIEDLVREEVRPLLTAWLDAHLPPIVERAVQAEIERIVGRQAG